MEVLDTVSEFYLETNQIDEATEIVRKMDTLLADYCSAYDTAQRYSKSHDTGHNDSNGIAEVADVRAG